MKKILTLLLATFSFAGMAADVNNLVDPGSIAPNEANGGGGCVITNMQGTFASGFLGYLPGGAHAIYIDPTATGGAGDPGCGTDFNGMAFDVESVFITLADQSAFGAGDGLGTATYQLSLHTLAVPGDFTQGPGPAVAAVTEVLTADGSGVYGVTTGFPGQEPLTEPFFVAWTFVSFVPDAGSSDNVVSPLWDAVVRPDGRQWVNNDGAGFVDHSTFFTNGGQGWIDVVVSGDFYTQGPPPMVPTVGIYALILLSLSLMWMVRSKVKVQ